MITIKVNDKEINCPAGWNELKCKQYLKLIELETKRETYLVDFLYTQRFLEILCDVEEGELDEFPLDELAELEPVITNNFSPDLLNDRTISKDHFIINGVTYSFYTQETIKKITLGEQAYIETLKTSGNLYDNLIKTCAVMIRPATFITTQEGLSFWKLDRFKADEVEHRAKILSENLSTKDLAILNNFFLTGANMSV